MLKKSKKIIALLATVASIIPLMPTSIEAAERLEIQEGTFEDAISFKDGKYIYKGYRTDEDDNAIYFNNGEKEFKLDDVEDADIEFKYSDKYVYVKDSDDEYFINLSNGQIEDDEELADKAKNVNSKLKTALKKTDRYGKINKVELDENSILASNNFSSLWYSYAAMPEDKADGYDDIIYGEYGYGLYGFTNESAKYIDISRTANMYVYSSKRDKMVKVDKFNDEDSDSAVEVRMYHAPIYLTQDEDFIYALTFVEAKDYNKGSSESKIYIQKISKEQGEQIDDAYLPKSVATYEISDKYDCDDADDIAKLMDEKYVYCKPKIVAKDGVIYVIQVNSSGGYMLSSELDDYNYEDADEMRITKFKLKKEKVNSDDPEIDSKLDVQLVERDDDVEQDIAYGFNSISIDVNGDIWALDKGKIIKFEDLEPKELYSCDTSLTYLDVYDSSNLIAWDGREDGDVFTVLQAGKKSSDSEKEDKNAEIIAVTSKNGWEKNSDGTWSYYKDNALVKGQWVQDGNWYYIKDDGIMATGWIQIGGNWYYLNQLGAMMTGWLENSDGKWYYLNPESGAMLSNTTIDGYVLGADGAWIK